MYKCCYPELVETIIKVKFEKLDEKIQGLEEVLEEKNMRIKKSIS